MNYFSFLFTGVSGPLEDFKFFVNFFLHFLWFPSFYHLFFLVSEYDPHKIICLDRDNFWKDGIRADKCKSNIYKMSYINRKIYPNEKQTLLRTSGHVGSSNDLK